MESAPSARPLSHRISPSMHGRPPSPFPPPPSRFIPLSRPYPPPPFPPYRPGTSSRPVSLQPFRPSRFPSVHRPPSTPPFLPRLTASARLPPPHRPSTVRTFRPGSPHGPTHKKKSAHPEKRDMRIHIIYRYAPTVCRSGRRRTDKGNSLPEGTRPPRPASTPLPAIRGNGCPLRRDAPPT